MNSFWKKLIIMKMMVVLMLCSAYLWQWCFEEDVIDMVDSDDGWSFTIQAVAFSVIPIILTFYLAWRLWWTGVDSHIRHQFGLMQFGVIGVSVVYGSYLGTVLNVFALRIGYDDPFRDGNLSTSR